MFYKNIQSKTFITISLFLLAVLAVSACGSTPTMEPITDITWQWTEMVETEPASQTLVPDPENYTLRFLPDGTLGLKVDCNMAGGSYTLDGTSLTIQLGPSTLAFCGEQSLDQIYLGFLSTVSSYSVENGQLVLELKEGAGRMTFARQ